MQQVWPILSSRDIQVLILNLSVYSTLLTTAYQWPLVLLNLNEAVLKVKCSFCGELILQNECLYVVRWYLDQKLYSLKLTLSFKVFDQSSCDLIVPKIVLLLVLHLTCAKYIFSENYFESNLSVREKLSLSN